MPGGTPIGAYQTYPGAFGIRGPPSSVALGLPAALGRAGSWRPAQPPDPFEELDPRSAPKFVDPNTPVSPILDCTQMSMPL